MVPGGQNRDREDLVMARSKSTIKISEDLIEAFNGGIRKAAAEQIANMVEEEFITALHDAPQYSGNYVANMSLGTSGIARRGEYYPFPKDPGLDAAYKRGQTPAIMEAIGRIENFEAKATAHITGKGGWLRELVVYNPLKYASVVEAYDNSNLRAENAGGAHALEKMSSRLQARHELLRMKV